MTILIRLKKRRKAHNDGGTRPSFQENKSLATLDKSGVKRTIINGMAPSCGAEEALQ
jgi:uncharacterized protein YbbK (DUF523 family)